MKPHDIYKGIRDCGDISDPVGIPVIFSIYFLINEFAHLGYDIKQIWWIGY